MDRPVLWQFTYSHFNEKARWALDFKRVPHVRRSLLPGPHGVKIRRMTGQTAVPVLELDGRVIHDSSRIIAALEEAFPDPPLYPPDEAERRRALELEDFFDVELGPHIRRLAFYLLLPFPDTVVAMFSQESGWAARAAFRAAFPMVRPMMKKAMRIDRQGAELGRAKTVAAFDRIAACHVSIAARVAIRSRCLPRQDSRQHGGEHRTRIRAIAVTSDHGRMRTSACVRTPGEAHTGFEPVPPP